MEPDCKNGSLKFGEFISHALDMYFPFDCEYGGDFEDEQSLLRSGDETSLGTNYLKANPPPRINE